LFSLATNYLNRTVSKLKMSKVSADFSTEYWMKLYYENEKRQEYSIPSIRDRNGNGNSEIAINSKFQFDLSKSNPMKGKTFFVDEVCQSSQSSSCLHQVTQVKLKWWAKECHKVRKIMSGRDIRRLFENEKILVPDHFNLNVTSEPHTKCLCFK
jgi:hypothetical protein